MGGPLRRRPPTEGLTPQSPARSRESLCHFCGNRHRMAGDIKPTIVSESRRFNDGRVAFARVPVKGFLKVWACRRESAAIEINLAVAVPRLVQDRQNVRR